jgi:hypothetical protein
VDGGLEVVLEVVPSSESLVRVPLTGRCNVSLRPRLGRGKDRVEVSGCLNWIDLLFLSTVEAA